MTNRFLGLHIACALVLLAAPCSTEAAPPIPLTGQAGNTNSKGRVFQLPGNKPERGVWLQDAGFGMFIHWSHDCQIGSVISHNMVGASDDYLQWYINELPKTFNPKRWDADEIAALAKVVGMKYVVLTTKHHNGFCLWDTKTTDFKMTNTPYGKDVVREFADAMRRQGIAVGFYYSPEDFAWLYRNGHEIRRTGPTLLDPDEDEEYGQFVEAQLAELFTQYGKVDMFFIDGVGSKTAKEACWKYQPDCLITRGEIATPEQFVPGKPPEGPWESNLTMGTQWQYKPTNDEYKSGTRILELLIETRAKGGSMMMNIGPKPNGEVPIEQESRLREVALWHAVNKECIHDTRPWIVANEENIWFTRSKDGRSVYAILTQIPDWRRGARKNFTLQSVKATSDTEVSVLGHDGKICEYDSEDDVTPRFNQHESGLEISVTRSQRLYNNHAWHNAVVVKLENVEPAFELPPYGETGEVENIQTKSAKLNGKLIELAGADQVQVGFEYQEYGGFAKAMYNTKWDALPMKPMTGAEPFSMQVTGLKPDTEYQYRVVVQHPSITVRGDHKLFRTLEN